MAKIRNKVHPDHVYDVKKSVDKRGLRGRATWQTLGANKDVNISQRAVQ
jgi:hypothetical protein